MSFLFFRFWAVRYIKLAIPSAFERTLMYRIVSYRITNVGSKFAYTAHWGGASFFLRRWQQAP